ncbi:MAG TPA: hypothetical protein VMR89_11745 [Actinomycetota bacterium]|nr:hypothetical protein [Actinomycetota bacterium]
MNEAVPILIVVLAVVVAGGVITYQHQRKLERQRELRALALGQRLDFSLDDPFDATGGNPSPCSRRETAEGSRT